MKYDIKGVRVTILILSTLMAISAKLEIVSPPALKEEFENAESLITQMGNFGRIPYGQSIVLGLHYDEKEPHGCKANDVDIASHLSKETDFGSAQVTALAHMVDRGDCTYVQQTRNIQKLGGALALIVDTLNEDISEVILSDDGSGAGLEIPAIMINKEQGAILEKFFKSASIEDRMQIVLKATFEPNRLSSNDVYAELWYTSSSDKSLDLIKNLAEYIEPINSVIQFEPKFVTWACPNCDSEFKKQNCLSDGLYCGSHHSEKVQLSGREVLMEDIRQYCVYALGKAEILDLKRYSTGFFGKPIDDQRIFFFEYVKEAHDLCHSRISEDCSKKAIKALGGDFEQVQQCVNGTFEDIDNIDKSENLLLKAQATDWQNYGHGLYPSLIINTKTFRGRLTPDNAFEALCAAFLREPAECRAWQEEMGIELPVAVSDGINQRTLFILIVALVLINIIIILAYRKYLQSELDNDMKIQVSSAVSQYVALSQIPELNENTGVSGSDIGSSAISIQGNAEGETKSAVTLKQNQE